MRAAENMRLCYNTCKIMKNVNSWKPILVIFFKKNCVGLSEEMYLNGGSGHIEIAAQFNLIILQHI